MEAEEKYSNFLRSLPPNWESAELEELKDQVKTERITQRNFIKTLEGQFAVESLGISTQVQSLEEELSITKKDIIDNELPTTTVTMVVTFPEKLKLINRTIPEYSGCTGINSQQVLGRHHTRKASPNTRLNMPSTDPEIRITAATTKDTSNARTVA